MYRYRALLGLCLALFPLFTRADSFDLEGTLMTYIKSKYPWVEVEIEDIRIDGDLPDGAPEWIAVEKSPPGKTVFGLQFKDGKEVTVTANLRAFDQVVMSRRALNKGHSLREDDLYVTMMDVTRIPKGAIGDHRRVIGRPLTRSVIANTPIVDYMVEDKTRLKKGRKVVLLTKSPRLTVTVVGELKEDGYVGDYVKAINLSSKKTITGMLIDENTVRVEY